MIRYVESVASRDERANSSVCSSMGEIDLQRNETQRERISLVIAEATCGAACRWAASCARLKVRVNDSGMSPCNTPSRPINLLSFWATSGRWQNSNSIEFSRSSSISSPITSATSSPQQCNPRNLIQHSNLSHLWALTRDLMISGLSATSNFARGEVQVLSSTRSFQYRSDKCWVPWGDRIISKKSDIQDACSRMSSRVSCR